MNMTPEELNFFTAAVSIIMAIVLGRRLLTKIFSWTRAVDFEKKNKELQSLNTQLRHSSEVNSVKPPKPQIKG